VRDLSFNLEDASQVTVGAFALAVPISFSEEAWRMGETLPLLNLSILMSMSLIFLAFYTYQNVFQGDIKNRVFVYIARILIAYGITALVVGLILFSLNKFPFFEHPLIALKRLIIIGMPASMGAIIVDSFDKE
jgi:uncharacterized membrane protein